MTKEKKEDKGKEMVTRDIVVSVKNWGFLYTIANEVRVATGRRCTPNEIITANQKNITTKTVLDRRKREEEKEGGKIPVADEEGKKEDGKRKSLLEAAIDDKEEREEKKENV